MTHPERRFAAWLDTTMQTRGISQAGLAREMGIADAQVSRWRRGQVIPSVHNLQRLAHTFGVPRAMLDELAGYPAEAVTAHDGVAQPAEDVPEDQLIALRYGRLIESVPRHLWPAYTQACEALARALAEAASSEASSASSQSKRTRTMGFRAQ